MFATCCGVQPGPPGGEEPHSIFRKWDPAAKHQKVNGQGDQQPPVDRQNHGRAVHLHQPAGRQITKRHPPAKGHIVNTHHPAPHVVGGLQLHQARHRLVAREVRDVDALDHPRRAVEPQHLLESREPLLRIDQEDLRQIGRAHV